MRFDMKIEMHMHTSEVSPCAKVEAAVGVKEYANAGYDGVVITDHFNDYVLEGFQGTEREKVEHYLSGYQLAKEEGEKLGIKVFFGIETCLLGGRNDYLIYGITPEFLFENPRLYESTLEQLYEIVTKAGGIVVQAHPYRGYCNISEATYLHGVEVYNGNPRHDSKNHLAYEFAKNHDGMLMTSGSDYHQLEDLAVSGMIFQDKISNEVELKEALCHGHAQVIQ